MNLAGPDDARVLRCLLGRRGEVSDVASFSGWTHSKDSQPSAGYWSSPLVAEVCSL